MSLLIVSHVCESSLWVHGLEWACGFARCVIWERVFGPLFWRKAVGMPITACQHLLLYVLTGRDGHSQCLALLSSSGPQVACLTGPDNTGKCLKNGGRGGAHGYCFWREFCRQQKWIFPLAESYIKLPFKHCSCFPTPCCSLSYPLHLSVLAVAMCSRNRLVRVTLFCWFLDRCYPNSGWLRGMCGRRGTTCIVQRFSSRVIGSPCSWRLDLSINWIVVSYAADSRHCLCLSR
jgi:hypothetical protein